MPASCGEAKSQYNPRKDGALKKLRNYLAIVALAALAVLSFGSSAGGQVIPPPPDPVTASLNVGCATATGGNVVFESQVNNNSQSAVTVTMTASPYGSEAKTINANGGFSLFLINSGQLSVPAGSVVFTWPGGPQGGLVKQYAAKTCPPVTPTTKSINAKALTDHGCNSKEWHFVINQVKDEASAPASIHVTWANSQSADVSLEKFTGSVAHYTTTANLSSTVSSATASIYTDWSGQFNLSHGPCPTPPPPTEKCPEGQTGTPPNCVNIGPGLPPVINPNPVQPTPASAAPVVVTARFTG